MVHDLFDVFLLGLFILSFAINFNNLLGHRYRAFGLTIFFSSVSAMVVLSLSYKFLN